MTALHILAAFFAVSIAALLIIAIGCDIYRNRDAIGRALNWKD